MRRSMSHKRVYARLDALWRNDAPLIRGRTKLGICDGPGSAAQHTARKFIYRKPETLDLRCAARARDKCFSTCLRDSIRTHPRVRLAEHAQYAPFHFG